MTVDQGDPRDARAGKVRLPGVRGTGNLNAQKLQLAGLIAAFVLMGAALLALLFWQWQTPNGRPHEIFGRHEFVRVEMPPAPPLAAAAEPDLALADTTEEEDEDEALSETDDPVDDEPGEGIEDQPAPPASARPTSRASFADRFGRVTPEVRNPTWLDLTFDLAQAGRSDTGVSVAKPVTFNGNTLGAIQLDFGGGSTVLVSPKELIGLLEKTSVDTSRLAALSGRDKVAFADLRAAGIDLRYRPAQDQLALELPSGQ